MTRTLFAGILFILLTNAGLGQKKGKESAVELSKNFDYVLSKPYEVVDGRKKEYFGKNGEVLTAKFQGDKCIIQKFEGSTLNEKIRKEYKDFADGFVVEEILEIEDHYYVFYSVWDKPNIKEQLFCREIDFETATFKDAGRKIISVNGKITGGFSVKMNWSGGMTVGGVNPKFSFEKSFDGSKLLVTFRKVPEVKSDKVSIDVIGMYAFDPEINEISGNMVKMPYTEAEMDNIGYTVDSDGDIYILAKINKKSGKSKDKSKKGVAGKTIIELLRIEKGKTESNTAEIDLPEKVINQIGFFEGPNGNLYLAGYYANEGKNVSSKTDGMFYFALDKNGALSKATDIEIPTEVLQQYMTEKAQKKLEKKEDNGFDAALYSMVLREMIVEEDGSIVFVGEQYYYIVRTDSKGNSSTTYYYRNMLVSKIDKDGKLAWMNQLPKSQSGKSTRGGMGYKYISSGENHYLLFLDNQKNISLGINEIPKLHMDGQGGFLTGFQVNDETGEIKRISILDTRDAKGTELFQFSTSRIVEIAKNEFAVECYKKKKEDVMIKITINE